MSDKYEIMEARDEEQILATAQGAIIKEMFYSFTIGGKKVTGISWVGTKEIARLYGGIKMGIPVVTDLGDQYACSVQATDVNNNVTLVGTSLQSKLMTKKGGEQVPDKFAYTKVTSKAQRNAIRALIPETFLLEMQTQFSAGAKPKPKPRPRRKQSSEVEPEPQEEVDLDHIVDPDEERVKTILATNDIPMDDFTIYKWRGKVRLAPKPEFPQENFEAYNDVFKSLLKAKWVAKEECWETKEAEAE